MGRPKLCLLLWMALVSIPCSAQDDELLAKMLANPVGAPNSVPLQANWNYNVGPREEGKRFVLNIQPVLPFSINEHWNLYSRTILPVVHQQDVLPGSGVQNGIADTVQQFFFSPKKSPGTKLRWGAGPVVLIPTGSEDLLTFGKWGAGPTAVALLQDGPWTVGALANQIWSFAGSDHRPDINQGFIQPFLAYTTSRAWSIIFMSESTYKWDTEEWTVPLNLLAAKVFKIGSQHVQLRAGPRYYAESTDLAPHGWGFRVNLILMFPE
ncbi:transporter [Microbulbifer pacificus]|uniref:transporter n=1 Tax=Microbulbifer pacificus TaxID=407164 RepID=UPI001F2AA5F5|nr:transporter [Microbulbifer pacificus]